MTGDLSLCAIASAPVPEQGLNPWLLPGLLFLQLVPWPVTHPPPFPRTPRPAVAGG